MPPINENYNKMGDFHHHGAFTATSYNPSSNNNSPSRCADEKLSSAATTTTCKYSYASWCPVCEKASPRRRTKSETPISADNDISELMCRRKCREMISLDTAASAAPPRNKYTKKQKEYENMVDVPPAAAFWYDNNNGIGAAGGGGVIRDCRIRSNLCELPTSYISNNCQKLTTTATPAVDHHHRSADLVDCLEKSVKTYEQTLKFVDYNNDMIEKQKLLQKNFALTTTTSSNTNCYINRIKSIQESRKRNPIDLKYHDYDTSTYFDRIVHNDDATYNLHERYTKEVDYLREELKLFKQDAGRQQQQHQTTTLLLTKKIDSNNSSGAGAVTVVTIQPPQMIKTIKSKVSLKTKSKLNGISSNGYRRINKSKTPTTSSTSALLLSVESAESDYNSGVNESDSELSDDDDDDNVNSEESNSNNSLVTETLTLPTTTTTTSNDTKSSNNVEEEQQQPLNDVSLLSSLGDEALGGNDTIGWPIRPSLFPHIPPYIRFKSHDTVDPVKLPGGRKYFKWKLSRITPIIVRKTLTNTGFVLVRNSNQWLGTWGKHMKSTMFKTLKEPQKLNHFPGTFQLGRKDRLWRNFQRLINKYGYKEFGFIPKTFVLPQDMKLLKHNWEYKNGDGNEMWIIKPPASARGVGIKVINKWNQLPKNMPLVVQKYISNPYLINGSKFDLRLYVLVTSFNPLRIYLYPDGLARFASAKYSANAKDLKDRFMHLTNYSINKLSSHYTANEDANACQGHKWTIKKLFEFMESTQGIDTQALWHALKQLVIKTIISAESPIYHFCKDNLNSRYNCYELFGIDVLLDEKLKPWLLEVNISPSLHSTSPLDEHVKGPLVRMLFDMVQFHFPIRVTQTVPDAPYGYDPKLYTTSLTKKERDKHMNFEQYMDRTDYLHDILEQFSGDDIRLLTQAEDELTVKGEFERIFPTAHTFKYLDFLEVRYYNRLFDAWETKYEKNRESGINLLRSLCEQKKHLKVAPVNVLKKNSPFMTPVALNLVPSKTGQSGAMVKVLQQEQQPKLSADNNNEFI